MLATIVVVVLVVYRRLLGLANWNPMAASALWLLPFRGYEGFVKVDVRYGSELDLLQLRALEV